MHKLYNVLETRVTADQIMQNDEIVLPDTLDSFRVAQVKRVYNADYTVHFVRIYVYQDLPGIHYFPSVILKPDTSIIVLHHHYG